MIQLNHNIKIGDTVNIDANLSWQVADAQISGKYKITQIAENGYASLMRDGNDCVIEVDMDTLSYLTGSHVNNVPPCQVIDPKEFQPSIYEEYGSEYLSEDKEELGFCYCGEHGDLKVVSMDLLNCSWCYINLPW